MKIERVYEVTNERGRSLSVHDNTEFYSQMSNSYEGLSPTGFGDGISYFVESAVVELKRTPGIYRIGDSGTKITFKGNELDIPIAKSKLEESLKGKFKLSGRRG
ncbi:MAG: hypothetical protein KKB62_02450 [Nanoarchaeota archaeon]|nr:hypothetical protein [Nanoarchaeota archaeon]